jgi:hypothetical protein
MMSDTKMSGDSGRRWTAVRRVGVVVALGVVGASLAGPLGSWAQPTAAVHTAEVADADPRTAPIPELPVESDGKSLVATADFNGRTAVTPIGAEVRIGAAPSHASDPPLLKLEVRAEDGSVLKAFNAWHPLWQFPESEDGREHLVVREQAQGSFAVPFDRDAATVAITDVGLGQQVVEVDLTEAIGGFCQQNPTDESCRVADLAVTGVSVATEPDLALVGKTSTVSIDTAIMNMGPASPMDATVTHTATPADAGLTVTPTTAESEHTSVLDEGQVVNRDYQVTCVTPGLHDITFASVIAPSHPADIDPEPGNDQGTSTFTVDCVVPVTLNVLLEHRALDEQALGVPIPVAILTTRAGEYGNPVAFDATRIDPKSTTFGTREVLLSGGGAKALLGRGIAVDAPERATAIRRDGDLDLLILYTPPSATGLLDGRRTNFRKGCALGEFSAGGTTLRFFGCGQDA